VTAVTTAGLLAGLFGSAFVPAVRAAAGGETYGITCTGEDYEVADVADGSPDGSCKFVYSVAPVVVVTVNNVDALSADPGTFTFTVSGGTIKSITTALGGVTTLGSTTVSPDGLTGAVALVDHDAGDDPVFTVTLNKIAAGKTATITIEDTEGNEDGEFTISSLAKSQKSVVSASKSTVDVATGLGAAVGGVHYVTWNSTVGASAFEVAVDVDNVYDASPTIQPLITATVTGPFSVAVSADNTNCNSVTAGEYESTSTGIADDDNQVCLIATDHDETSAGKGTLTVSAGGVTLKTAALNMLGQVTKIVPTQSIMYFADGGTLDGTATFRPGKLTYYDSANNNLNTYAATATIEAIDDAVTFEQDGEASAAVGVGDGVDFQDDVTPADASLSYDDICDSAFYDSGDKTVLQAFYENADETEVTSASWTVTCTDADGIITKLAMAAGSANPGSDVKVLATVTDSEGLPCGYGCVVPDVSTLTVTPEGTAGEDELAEDDNETALDADYFDDFDDTISDGSAYVKVGVPTDKGNYAMILEYDDVTAGDLVEGSWTLRIASANVSAAPSATSLTAGAKKLSATADFGATAGGAKIAFTLERSNGTVKTYYRKANADGVATFTLRFKGTYEVTASFGDYITDTVILKK
jgi:hypothetical protein